MVFAPDMGYRRRKIVFDTQIISNVASGRIPKSRWSEICGRLKQTCRHAISFNTLAELLDGIAGGDTTHFEENLERIRALYVSRNSEFFPLVGDFVRRQLFGLPFRRDDFAPEKLRRWVEVVRKANNKTELDSGLVDLRRSGHSNRNYGFDFALLKRQMNEGRDLHSKALEELRQGQLLRSGRTRWAASVLRLMEVAADPVNQSKLLDSLDAAWNYDEFLYNLAQKQVYDFAKHDSDWIDFQQLFYLADPHVVLITMDTNIKFRTKASIQSDRILSLDELQDSLNP